MKNNQHGVNISERTTQKATVYSHCFIKKLFIFTFTVKPKQKTEKLFFEVSISHLDSAALII